MAIGKSTAALQIVSSREFFCAGQLQSRHCRCGTSLITCNTGDLQTTREARGTGRQEAEIELTDALLAGDFYNPLF